MNVNPEQEQLSFLQIHIDAARNSTDDFNLFHDPRKWQRIHGNPFGGPIALGFQLECLIEERLRLYREQHDEVSLIRDQGLRFSHYQLTFASVVRPGEAIQVDIKKSQLRSDDNPTLSNRVALRNQNGIVLLGHKKESHAPLLLHETGLPPLGNLKHVPDRSYLGDSGWFYKRKFMNTGNAKNFLSGSLADQSAYFDELEDRVRFPETFPVALISCALLERGFKNHHDFEKAPMVYTSHQICIDRELNAQLKSNDMLHLLISPARQVAADKGLGGSAISQCLHRCFGLLHDHSVLFRAEIAMAPLAAILDSVRKY